MFWIERRNNHAGEPAIAIEEGSCELDRPSLAGSSYNRLTDVQSVLVAVAMNAVVLAVAQIDCRGGLRPCIGCAHDAVCINDGDLNDDFAEHILRANDRVEARRRFLVLDAASQVEKRFVYFSD